MGALTGLAVAAPELSTGLPENAGLHRSTDGVVDLKWSGDGPIFQLEEAPPEGGFAPRYEGPDRSSVRTGLAAGTHLFRVREVDESGVPGEWSEPLAVEVAYMAAGRVRLLLILGGAVVLATIGAILHGHITHRKEARE